MGPAAVPPSCVATHGLFTDLHSCSCWSRSLPVLDCCTGRQYPQVPCSALLLQLGRAVWGQLPLPHVCHVCSKSMKLLLWQVARCSSSHIRDRA